MENKSSTLIEILTKSMDEISQANDNQEINNIVEKLLMKFTDSDHVDLLLFNPLEQTLYAKKKNTTAISMIDADGLLGNTFLTKVSAFYNHIISEKNYIAKIDNPSNIRLRSQIIVPIVEDDILMGIVRASRSIQNRKTYSKHELDLIASLNSFLVKIIHIMTSNNQTDYQAPIDTSEVNEQIIEVEKNYNNSTINDNSIMSIASIIHDIRTPANSLFGFLELIEEQVDDKRLKSFVANAKESAHLINTLTDSILEESKHLHSKQLNTSSINSIKFFRQIADSFSANMFEKEINYLIYLDPGLPKEIEVDSTKLQRVIINLIGNAYKFTPRDKSIIFNVKFDKNDKTLKISITDEGIGIDKSQQEDIFKAYSQAEENTHARFGGSGLGLSISAKYTDIMGGELKVKSELGKGSKFYFMIPVKVTDDTSSYENLSKLNQRISILSDNPQCIDANNIKKYLISLKMPSEKIFIEKELNKKTTHLFCFQHKITSELLEYCKKKNIKTALVEEKIYSLSKKFKNIDIMSEKTYYGDAVHSLVFAEAKTKILIAEDNKINIMLLESMLEAEYVDITAALDGTEALELLKYAHNENNSFNIVLLDKHMPSMSGSEILQKFREFEKENDLKPIFAVSITGDPTLDAKEKSLYNLLLSKPFSKEKVREIIKQSKL